MVQYNVITETNEATVVTEYKPTKTKSDAYQSEAELEKEFIKLLQEQAYEYLSIKNEKELIKNLRLQLEKLNHYQFSDTEWEDFFKTYIANPNDHIVEKTRTIQEDYIKNLKRDDGTTKNIKLIDKDDIHNNSLQVINQYEVEGAYKNRYDVTILVNGLPLVHTELKRRGVNIKEAFNQINRYQRDSFWAESGLFEYVQIFVISNGTLTKYYSNTTRFNHIKNSENNVKKIKTSNSFEFTSYWADANNKILPDIVDFTRTFFSKHTLLNILTKYCVFTVDDMLMVMRPYQIVATERILNRIGIATNYKQYGTVKGGGYIWHTTGSGKTLTSFKTARLASKLDYIDKVLFVVDRQDLDYQTMREYNKFEKDSANSNKSTNVLARQLGDSKCKIIITTIQKLSCFIKKYQKHEIFDKKVVLIFDECHRTQFGEMHQAVTKSFKKCYLFGFTGTPIFTVNSSSNNNPTLKTTEQAFGDQLHRYTVIDAINDKNVLPFKVDYIKTLDAKDDIVDEDVWDIKREEVYNDPKRISMITDYIIKHFNQKTHRNDNSHSYVASVVSNVEDTVNSKNRKEIKVAKNINGFNSIFATSSVNSAILYYKEFKKQLANLAVNSDLKVAMIYSFKANEEENGNVAEEDSDSVFGLDVTSCEALESAIKDYNEMFQTNYDTTGNNFQSYYKDVSLRMKNKEIDILIVVNMFLTGFDATTLNTLWVDKNLKMHGLIQAFSRTNRILNSVKNCGNIVCFRNLQKQTDEAISLFGDNNASGIILLKSFNDYYNGYADNKEKYHEGYKEIVERLKQDYPLDERIVGEQNQKKFVVLYGSILKMRNLLSCFDDFSGKEILTPRNFEDYNSIYLDIRDEFIKRSEKEPEKINDDIVFEVELLKQVDINVDYILELVEKYHDSHCKDKEIIVSIQKILDSSFGLRSKKELILSFVNGLNEVDDVVSEWHNYIAETKEKALKEIIDTENLKEEETKKFVNDCFKNGEVKVIGTEIGDLFAQKITRFGSSDRPIKKRRVLSKIKDFFENFYGM